MIWADDMKVLAVRGKTNQNHRHLDKSYKKKEKKTNNKGSFLDPLHKHTCDESD